MSVKAAISILIGTIAGIGCAELICWSTFCRDTIGRACGRGHLVALVKGTGIYQADVDLAAAEFQSRRTQNESAEAVSTDLILPKLIASAAALKQAEHEKISAREVERESALSVAQFRDAEAWAGAMRANRLSASSLRQIIRAELKGRRWLSRQIAPQLQVNPEECRAYYERHKETYSLPLRIRANHLFLAAPLGTPQEVVDLKKGKIESLSKRIKAGESLAELCAVESEDEASRARGGDLGFFSAYRMPNDFFAATTQLRLGEISEPVRTALGFHIIQVTQIEPGRLMAFEEVRAEIQAKLEAERRSQVLQKLIVDLNRQAQIL